MPRGRLRIDLPVTIGLQYVMPALPRFSAAYPELRIVATLTDQRVDLIADGVDVALRVGDLEDSSFVARKVYESRFVAAASPSYLRRHGEPESPEALEHHSCLGYYRAGVGRVENWIFERDGKRTARAFEPALFFDPTYPFPNMVSGRIVEMTGKKMRMIRVRISIARNHQIPRNTSSKGTVFPTTPFTT